MELDAGVLVSPLPEVPVIEGETVTAIHELRESVLAPLPRL
jgi:hypothetical protein